MSEEKKSTPALCVGDALYGGSRNDRLEGGTGNDYLIEDVELKNWNGATCAVLFVRVKREAANDAAERKVA